MKKIIYLIVILSLKMPVAISQVIKDNAANFKAEFKFVKKQIPDSLVINTYPTGASWDGIVTYYAFKDKEGYFKFSLPKISQPLLFLLSYVNSSGSRIDIGQYYAERNDNIEIQIFEGNKKDTAVFMGKGSSKYNLINKIVSEQRRYSERKKNMKGIYALQDIQDYLAQHTLSIKNAIERKNSLINNYSDEISHEMKKLIGYQFGNYDQQWRSQIFYGYVKDYKDIPENRKLLKDYYLKNYHQFLKQSDSISVLSMEHFKSLLETFRAKAIVNSENGEGNIIEFYNSLKEYCSSPNIKERLLIQYLMGRATLNFISKPSINVQDSIVKDATKFLVSTKGRNLASRIIGLQPGAKFFDANFVDLNGNLFNTATLRGKIFIIDLWGIGCTGCATFHKMFHNEIWPKLRKNDKFQFLSVSIDGSGNRWKNGLDQNMYSSLEYKNVYIGDIQWSTHPFLQHYSINSVPFILLVDANGRIIRKIENIRSPSNLFDLISEALTNANGK